MFWSPPSRAVLHTMFSSRPPVLQTMFPSSHERVLQTMLPSTYFVLQTMFSSPRAVPQTNEPLRSPHRTLRQLRPPQSVSHTTFWTPALLLTMLPSYDRVLHTMFSSRPVLHTMFSSRPVLQTMLPS